MNGAAAAPVAWEREWLVGGVVSHRFGRVDGMVVAEWVGIGRLFATVDGSRSRFDAVPGADPGVVSRIRQFVGEGLLRHLRGEIALHASAVTIDGYAVAFVGLSGAGKSSIAAALCERSPVELAADDTLFVARDEGTFRVMPSERANRLAVVDRPDAIGLKLPVTPARIARTGVPLAAIVSLAVDAETRRPRLAPLEGAARFRAVNDALVRFVWDDDATNLRDFQTISSLVSDVRVLELRRSWDLAAIGSSADAVLEARSAWSEK